MSDSSILFEKVSLEFPVYNLAARSLKKSFIRLGTGGKVLAESKHILVRALDNVSFQIEHGDRVGLIGHNGAGKSTLLRTIADIYEPTVGQVSVRGKVVTLLDMMLGIEDESTGYENIVKRSYLMGLSKKDINLMIDDIAAFTGLGDYLSVPIRTYSSGMKLRLAFAVATSIVPEILLMDEIVSAGDASFMEKAEARIFRLIKESSIVVIASHSDEIIHKFCNKVIYLEAGRVKFFGGVEKGLALYANHI